jgi:hypothetical protein
MEAICSSESSIDFQRTTRRYIPEDGTPHFSTLRMEAACSSETSVDFQRTTWRYIAEDGTLHPSRRVVTSTW